MKTVVITGASRGIGLASAKEFLKNNWRVIGTYNQTLVPINDTQFTALKLNLSSPDEISRVTKEIGIIASEIDVLVNNAGIIMDNKTDSIDIRMIRETLEVNVFGLIDFTQQILPFITKKGGHIINIDSEYGSFSYPIDDETSTGYRLSKAALNMYTRILAFHLLGKGIQVSSLDPGWVETDMGNAVADESGGPDRKPEQPAKEIFELATTISESGRFWRFGKIRQW